MILLLQFHKSLGIDCKRVGTQVETVSWNNYTNAQNDKSKIVEMSSAQGERVEMEYPVEAKGDLVP